MERFTTSVATSSHSETYSTGSLGEAVPIELHTFSDASESGIAAVSYLLTYYEDGNCDIGFAMRKAKVAPIRSHTIPQLELCAAVLASDITETVKENLDIKLHTVKYYTDSKVVLGYIHNQSRRFYTYVSNRVDKIRTVSSPNQWNFVPTHLNPADDGSRGLKVSNLQDSKWLMGPQFLLKETAVQDQSNFPLVTPDDDVEIRQSKDISDKCFFPYSWYKTLRKVFFMETPSEDCSQSMSHSCFLW